MARPYNIKTEKEMQEKIDEYFEHCKGHILYDDDGKPIFNKYGEIVVVDAKPPTVTGLAHWLGLKSRQALLNYQGRKQFNDTVMRAKLRIEQYAEERLFDKDGSRGAQFSLTYNFKWGADETEKEVLDKLDEVLDNIKGNI